MSDLEQTYLRWKLKQRELDDLERELRDGRLSAAYGETPAPPRFQLEMLERLREEVDSLLPAAMQELETVIGERVVGRDGGP